MISSDKNPNSSHFEGLESWRKLLLELEVEARKENPELSLKADQAIKEIRKDENGTKS